MKIATAVKTHIRRGIFVFALLIFGIAACTSLPSKTPTPVPPTKSVDTSSYQILPEKSFGRGIAEVAEWAPDGSSFAVATSAQVDLYDAQTFDVIATLDTKQWTKVMAYSPDGQWLAAGGEDGTVQLWDVASRKLVHQLVPKEEPIFEWWDPLLTFSSDSQTLVSALDQTLYLWDVSTGKLLDSFPGHLDGIFKIAMSPDKKVLVAVGFNSIYVRDIATRELLYPPIVVDNSIEAIFFGQDPGQFQTVNSDSTMNYTTGTSSGTTRIQTWDVFRGEILEQHLATRTETHLIEVAPAQQKIVLARDGEISIWDTSLKKVVLSMPGKTSRLASIAMSPNGDRLITVGGTWGNGLIQIWDSNSQNAIKTIDLYNLSPEEAVFSPNEKLVAIASGNHITQIREVDSGRLLFSFDGGGYLAFSPDSKTIAFATGQNYNKIVLASTETGEYLPVPNFSCPELKGLAFHPDGKSIVFSGFNCDLQLRDVQTGKVILNFSQVEGNEYLSSYRPIFSSDGKRIALGGYRPKVLDTKTGKTIRELEVDLSAEAAFSPDGRYLLFSGMGHYSQSDQLQVWDVAADRVAFNISTLQDQYNLKDLVFSPDGRILAIVGKTVELWDLWNGKPLAELKPSGDPPVAMMLSSDNQTLVTIEPNGTIQHWSIQPNPELALHSQPTPTPLPTLPATPVLPTLELTQLAELGKGYSSPVSRSSDGKLAAFFEGAELKWFDAATLKQLGSIEIEDSYGPVIFSPDNKTAIVGSFAGAYIVDLKQPAIVGRVSGGNGGTSGYTFSRDSHFLAYTIRDHTTGGPYHRIGLWDVVEQKEAFAEYDYFRTLLEDRYHTMSDPAISPDGNLVAAGHSDKRVYIWDLHTGKSYLTLEGHAEEVTGVDFSPNGRILASGSLDGTIRLWDPSTGKLIKVLTGFTDDIYDLHFHSDGRSLRILYAEDQEQLVMLDTGKINPIPTPRVTPDPLELQQYREGFSAGGGTLFGQVLFSPDGNTLALAGQNILLWDVSTQKLLNSLDNSNGGFVRGMAFNEEGTLLAITTDEDNVLVWDVNTGQQLFNYKSNFLFGATVIAGYGDSEPGLARGASSVAEQSLAFLPDGDLLAFGNDNAIEIWNVRNAEKMTEFVNPEGSYATKLSFSDDGKRLYVILNRNREAQIWDTNTGQLLKQVNLTEVDPNAYTAVALRAPFFARNNSDGNSGWIELWNLDKESFIKINAPSSENEPLLFSPDGSLLAARVSDTGIHFWKTASGALIYQTEIDSRGLAISAENRTLAAGLDGRAILYDLRPILNLSGRFESQVPQATPTPLTFAWPTTTPVPLPTNAGGFTSNVISSENVAQITEKARFGNGTIDDLVWSPDGDSILTAGSLGVSAYSLQESTNTWSPSSLVERPGWTYEPVQLPDGRALAVSVDGDRVRVWDVSTGRNLANVEGAGEPAISPDGSLLVYADPDDVLQTWDLANARPVASLNSSYAYSHWPIFSPDGKWVAAIQSLRRYADWIRIWDARTGEIVNALGGPDNDITDLSFSDDGKFVVGAAGGSAWIWDVVPGAAPEEIRLYEGKIDGNLNLYPHTVTAAALDPASQIVAIGTSENDIWIYDRQTKRSLFELEGHSSPVRHVRFRRDGQLLASVDEDGTLMIWEMASHQRIAVLDDHKGTIDGLIFRTDGNLAAWGSGIAWQIDPVDETLQHTISINSGKILAVSPAGDFLAVYNPFQVSLLDAGDGKFLQTLEGEAQEPMLDYRQEGMAFRQFYSAAFSHDGRYLATAGSGGVWYYDLATKNLIQQLPGSNAQKVAFSPDGDALLTSLDEQANPVAVYDIRSGGQLFALDEYGWGANYLRSTFSPDGRWVAAVKSGWGQPPELMIYDSTSYQIYRQLPLEEDVRLTSLAFSPSGNLLAAGKEDGEIFFISFPDLKIIATVSGHHGTVEHLIFSSDGQHLISASQDGTIRTWGLP